MINGVTTTISIIGDNNTTQTGKLSGSNLSGQGPPTGPGLPAVLDANQGCLAIINNGVLRHLTCANLAAP